MILVLTDQDLESMKALAEQLSELESEDFEKFFRHVCFVDHLVQLLEKQKPK